MTFNKHHIGYALLAVLYLVIYYFIVRPENLKLKNRINELNKQNDSLVLNIKQTQFQIKSLDSVANILKFKVEQDKNELTALKAKSDKIKNKYNEEHNRINNLSSKFLVSEFTDAFE